MDDVGDDRFGIQDLLFVTAVVAMLLSKLKPPWELIPIAAIVVWGLYRYRPDKKYRAGRNCARSQPHGGMVTHQFQFSLLSLLALVAFLAVFLAFPIYTFLAVFLVLPLLAICAILVLCVLSPFLYIWIRKLERETREFIDSLPPDHPLRQS